MPKMPKKQQKNKKREEKKKQMKALENQPESQEAKLEKEKWGHFYIVIFVGVAILGAGIIIYNA